MSGTTDTRGPRTDADPAELARFERVAARWWDPEGEFAPLHRINPLRSDYIASRVDLDGARVLDVGCGGGLLAEALADRGAEVTGIDLGETAIQVARLHLHESGHDIRYEQIAAHEFADAHADSFDLVTCLELLEHVPEPSAVVAACAKAVRPGGDLIFSTINRNPKAWFLAVLGAEYVLRMVPRGTHDYRRFIRPSELAAWGRAQDLAHRLVVEDITGMHYDLLADRFSLAEDVDVNYLMHLRREGD